MRSARSHTPAAPRQRTARVAVQRIAASTSGPGSTTHVVRRHRHAVEREQHLRLDAVVTRSSRSAPQRRIHQEQDGPPSSRRSTAPARPVPRTRQRLRAAEAPALPSRVARVCGASGSSETGARAAEDRLARATPRRPALPRSSTRSADRQRGAEQRRNRGQRGPRGRTPRSARTARRLGHAAAGRGPQTEQVRGPR